MAFEVNVHVGMEDFLMKILACTSTVVKWDKLFSLLIVKKLTTVI